MRYLYSLLLYLFTPYFLLQLWWKGKKIPAYRQRISERFCLDNAVGSSFDVWLHAVSLGEVIAASPLIDALLKNKKTLLITTMTPTGAEAVLTRFGSRVKHRYIPYDLPQVVRRFLKKYNAKIAVIIETEIWPNLMAEANRVTLPVLLVNARLSPRSFKSYKKWRFFFEPILKQFTEIVAQSDEDAKRFIALGADKKDVSVSGNIKFDLQINLSSTEFADSCKAHWESSRIILMAASTHEGEEIQLLEHLTTLKHEIPNLMLLIAPRHPERFETVYNLSKQYFSNVGICSRQDSLNNDNEVVILDSLGQLLPFYQLSHYAFVGGSLMPIGGHNVLEPIAMGTPVLTGPHRHNFKAICDGLESAEAIILVNNAKELVKALCYLHNNTTAKNTLVEKASRFLNANKGVVTGYVEKIEYILNNK